METNKFKKGDYIVVKKFDPSNLLTKKMVNYCFKLLKFNSNHRTDLVNCSEVTNIIDCLNSDNGYNIKASIVRFATPEEIKEYDRIDEPYDVTDLKTSHYYKVKHGCEGRSYNQFNGRDFRNGHYSNKFREPVIFFKGRHNKHINGFVGDEEVCFHKDALTSSTKEEYDNQFKTKEEATGFVLPKKWCVNITPENSKILHEWGECSYVVETNLVGAGRNFYAHSAKIGAYPEITFDQFKKYVLKNEEIDKIVKTKPDKPNPKTISESTESSPFKFNRWYSLNNHKTLIFVKKEFKDCFGFTAQGDWKNNWNLDEYTLKPFRKASKEEVNERLLEYANKYYSKGVNFISVTTTNGKVRSSLGCVRFDMLDVDKIPFNIKPEDGYISATVYKKGKWAEIISTPKTEVKEEVVEDFRSPKFKLGDWIVVLDTKNVRFYNSKAIGKTMQIIVPKDAEREKYFNGFLKGDKCAIIEGNKYGVNYYLEDIRKATPEEIAEVAGCKEVEELQQDATCNSKSLESNLPEYYEYISDYSDTFTKGKTYKIINKNDLEANFNFIDDRGVKNGFSGDNFRYFKPVVKKLELTTKPINLENTKIWIGNNPELMKKVQTKLFELGYHWSGDKKYKLSFLNNVSLILYKGKSICYSSIHTANGKSSFDKHANIEIFPSDLGIDQIVMQGYIGGIDLADAQEQISIVREKVVSQHYPSTSTEKVELIQVETI